MDDKDGKAKGLVAASVSHNTFDNIDTGGGDFFVGVTNHQSSDRIAKIIEASKAWAVDSPEFSDLLDEIDNYEKPRPNRTIIGLAAKLQAGKRNDLLPDAMLLKNRVNRKFAKYQFQGHKMAVNNYVYGKINEIFKSKVSPLIRKNSSIEEIDTAISEIIILPLADEVCIADPTFNSDTIRGMLYILTGNCHIEWN